MSEPQSSPAETNPNPVVDLSIYKSLFIEQARIFLTELYENVAELSKYPQAPDCLQKAHRAAHTLKGMASTMRYDALAEIAREMERPFATGQQMSTSQIEIILAHCHRYEEGLVQLAAESE